MAGHSKWANIKHRKARQDAVKGKAWSKCSRAIMVAVKNGGPDSDTNLTLRYAILDAKSVNMPKDTIEKAIKKGTGVLPVYAAANHDPDAFDDPQTFDIARDPNHHLGFGHGTHFCLGAQLARLETQIALRNLLERNPNLRLAVDPGRLRLQALPGWHRYESLPVALG